MKEHNTFLTFSLKKNDNGGKTLRRSSTDPCLVSPSERTCTTEAPPEWMLKVFVGSLPATVDEHYLEYFMSYFGEVKSAVLKRNLTTGQSRRYGYVRFKKPPKPEIFAEPGWMIGEKLIRIRPYAINPCWKNEYHSGNEADE